ncbi:MAG: zinc-binding dehydrogenase [Candidatus Latescibacterota bacterium]|nr:zinc-binding dehydrogenase [Candidatus Latescibacterota bacterium]
MYRLAKPEGAYQIELEDVPVPEIKASEVLIRTERTLISRGSEIWRRYAREEAIDPAIMGYSLVGSIAQVGAQVPEFSIGDRVAALAPHAEWVAVEVVNPKVHPSVVSLPGDVSSEVGTFWPLGTSSAMWMDELDPQNDETVVIMGQGLVGSGCLQALKAKSAARVFAVDAIPARCDLSITLGADLAIDVSKEDPVEATMEATGGEGANSVVYAVGGRSGTRAFEQAQDMVRRGGLIQVIGLYEDENLPLDSAKIQGKRLQGGFVDMSKRPAASDRSIQLIAEGKIDVDAMITHRVNFREAAEAYDMLYSRLHECMAVILEWN